MFALAWREREIERADRPFHLGVGVSIVEKRAAARRDHAKLWPCGVALLVIFPLQKSLEIFYYYYYYYYNGEIIEY